MDKRFEIDIDVYGKTVPTDYSWQFGIGSDHAFQVLRKDVCEHLKLAHDELGFKYVRFHGIFDDDMRIIQSFADVKGFSGLPHAEEIKETSFKRVAVCLDNVLSCGLKPFIELSFMPTALASGKTQGLAYVNNITMPKDVGVWSEFIKSFIHFLLDRYGEEEVKNWYFEVWNEPDLPIFFDGSKEDYFALYKATVCAVKEVCEDLKVGGPATSACKWLTEFKDFCDANSVPCDFISTHHYPGDAFGNIVSDKNPKNIGEVLAGSIANKTDMGDTMTAMFFDSEKTAGYKKGEFVKMDEEARMIAGDKPLFITEWNCSATYAAPIHDEKFSAAFIVKSVLDIKNTADGYMFWCCSDIFEEMYDLGKPFHGSFGIISNDGIPKPNFWAFKMLSQLYQKRLDLPVTNEPIEYAVFLQDDKAQVLLYAQDFDYNKNDKYSVTITLNRKATKIKKQVIDQRHCNPKAQWQKYGSPDLLTYEQVANIKKNSELKTIPMECATDDDKTRIELNLHTNDVVLLIID